MAHCTKTYLVHGPMTHCLRLMQACTPFYFSLTAAQSLTQCSCHNQPSENDVGISDVPLDWFICYFMCLTGPSLLYLEMPPLLFSSLLWGPTNVYARSPFVYCIHATHDTQLYVLIKPSNVNVSSTMSYLMKLNTGCPIIFCS